MNLTSLLFLATDAMAQATEAAPAKGPSLIETLTLPLGFLVIMYFLIIRPQQKKAKDQANLMSNLKAGDEVVTTGGIIGKIRSVSDQFITLEISQNTAVKVLKGNITGLTKQIVPVPAGKEAPAKA